MIKKNCVVCGKEFEAHNDKQKYCSRKCFASTKKKKIIKVCPICGKEFETVAKHRDKTYCSPNCVKTLINEKRRNSIIGEKFYKLTVLEWVYARKGHNYYLCQCECGNKKIVSNGNLISGHVKSCGCLSHDTKPGLTHNMAYTRFWRLWASMKARCNTTNKKSNHYKTYSSKGISYCKEWESFENFKKDMFKSYTEHVKIYGERNTSLDRIDNNNNYCKSNCRWATLKEQVENRKVQKKFKAISPNNRVYYSCNQTDFAKKFNLSSNILNRCLNSPNIYKSHKGWKFVFV